MANVMKKSLSLVLALLMTFSCAYFCAPTVAAAATSGECGSNLKWSYNTSTYTLTISGTGAMTDYIDAKYNDVYVTTAPWKTYYNVIKTVVIQDGVTSIGSYAFHNCTNLTSVTIGKFVTSIGGSAFYNTALYNDASNWDNNVLYIGNHLIEAKDTLYGSYTVKPGTKTIADYAFYFCESLTSVVIPDSVTSIGDCVFYCCTNLTSVTIPDSVTSVGGGAFYGCRSLTSVTIPDFVTSIGNDAFSYCTSLTSVTIPDSVTSIGSDAFYKCPNVTIHCHENSYAESYATENSIPYELIDDTSVPGDANGDGKVNVSDVTAILKYIANWGNEINTDSADVNKDGKVNLSDVTLLLKYLANWDVVLK